MLYNYLKENCEIERKEDRSIITIEAPALDKSRFNIYEKNKHLIIEHPALDTRVFTLPSHKKIEAEYKNDVLSVEVIEQEADKIKVL